VCTRRDPDFPLHATGLTKTFGDFAAVDGIDFEVKRGDHRRAISELQHCAGGPTFG